ncbi:MAG: alpha/beta hydrolase family protein [Sphingomonadaceae bacterium]
MKRLIRLTSIAAVILASAQPAMAQKPAKGAPRAEGELSRHINLDAKDAETKLEIIQHEVFEAQQQNIRIEFMLKHGSTTALDFVQYPSGSELIPGYVFTPASGVPAGEKRPAVVVVHGGFHERFNVEWFPLITSLVQRGYVVIFPEYRGSRGYGSNHYRNDYGVTDTADVLAAAAYIARKPFVDSERLAIVGESRGGMLTLLAIQQQPTRFKAAVDVVGLTDFVAYMAYKPEYRRQEVARENPSFGGKLPNENLAAYMAVSPINHVDKIQTPLLVMASTGDMIAPITLHTGRLLDALKARNKVHEAKIYENAPGGHVFMHGDQPERDDAYARIFAWLDRYVKP